MAKSKADKKLRKQQKRQDREFAVKLARIYGMDASDLSSEAGLILRAAGDFHLSAFGIVDQAKSLQDRASLSAFAEGAIIRTFDLKKMKAHPQEHIPHVWDAQKNGVVPEALRSVL